MKRVVITGLGCCVPSGDSVSGAWNTATEKKSWIKVIDSFDVSHLKSKVASMVDITTELQEKYDFLISAKERRRIDNFEYIATIASYKAMEDSGLLDKEFDKDGFGSFIATGVGGIKSMQETISQYYTSERKRISPFFLPASLANMCAGNVAIKFGLKGPCMAHVSACASSTHAIGEAFTHIREGRMTGCLTGGSESAVCEIGVSAFDAMNALSSSFNDNSAKASRALDKNRDGFVIGEGSVVLVLEELEHAKNRGAKIYCEVVGYGASCDAGHITAPDPEGKGAGKAMQIAVKDASITADKIDYINLHGTSTPLGDKAEITAIKNVFGEHSNKVAISSTKSITGHLLGSAGALEAMFCAKAIEEQILPPSANIDELDEVCEGMNILTNKTKTDVNYTTSNSFGFGGTNGCLIFKKYVD